MLNRKLFEQSREDPLTQLGNRRRLREEIEMLRARVERYGHSYSAVLCDVDYFKVYNDHYGHLAGDEVLQKVAQMITDQCRSGDTAYRYGEEEFLVILPEQSLESAIEVADRLRRKIEALQIPHEANDPPGVVTISAGVATVATFLAEAPKSTDDLLGRPTRRSTVPSSQVATASPPTGRRTGREAAVSGGLAACATARS